MGDQFQDLDANGFWPDTSYFVPYVQRIMNARGWYAGARFQQRWLSSGANELVGEAKDGQGNNGPLGIEPIEMQWVLDFQRSRDLLAELTSYELLTNEATQGRLIPQINALLADGSTQVNFGWYPDGAARESIYLNSRAVTAEMAYAAGLDDLNAALGAFNMFVMGRGTATINDDLRVVVQYSDVGVYVRDSFDFEGAQALGHWKLPDQIEMPSIREANSSSWWGSNQDAAPPPARPDDWVPMTNLAYRMYRNRTGYGGDFIVYSDVKIVPVTFDFDYPAPPQFR